MRNLSKRISLVIAVLLALPLVTLAEPPSKPTDTTGKKKVTTDLGLKYVDLKVGEGDPVKAGDNVEVHYTGWLTNGKKFDSSLDRNEPFTVKNVGKARVIKGWNEGLIGMKKGGKRQLIIPSKLAYGENGAGDAIPPNADLIFEIEVLKISK